MKREERELLEAQSIPLRNYLMTYVMPTLMQGLNECCKVRPEDPVDFLVRFLQSKILKVYLFYVYVCFACMYLCTLRVCSSYSGPKRALYSMELQL